MGGRPCAEKAPSSQRGVQVGLGVVGHPDSGQGEGGMDKGDLEGLALPGRGAWGRSRTVLSGRAAGSLSLSVAFVQGHRMYSTLPSTGRWAADEV